MNWFENKEFWSLFYEWMFPSDSFDEARKQVEKIVSLTGLNSGNVLDLCCGPGRHSIPLSKIKFNVTSVDLNTFLLQKAIDYAKNERVEIEFIKENMLKFRRNNYFDLALSMYSSFGYFEDKKDDLKVLKNIYLSLKKNGSLVLDLRGKEIHALKYKETVSYEMPNGDLIIQRNKTKDSWSVCESNWLYIKGTKVYSFELILNLYSGKEITDLLRKVGFRDIKLFGDLSGSKYDDKAERLIVMAFK